MLRAGQDMRNIIMAPNVKHKHFTANIHKSHNDIAFQIIQ